MRVLLIDDEPRVTGLIARYLERHDVEVTSVETGRAGLEHAVRDSFDVIVLDIAMPDWDGHETLERIRAAGVDTPVVFLTASDATEHVVRALESGGDDFVPKPFEPRELLARLRALARRRAEGAAAGRPVGALLWGDLRIDPLQHRAFWREAPVDLTSTELRILQALTLAQGGPVTREELMRIVWGPSPDVGPESLGVHVSNLRKRLDAAGASGLVQTVRGEGYRLAALPG